MKRVKPAKTAIWPSVPRGRIFVRVPSHATILLAWNNRAGAGSDSLVARILIADDHRANREALAALLEPVGHEVLTANDGSRGLDLARSHAPDLVISDVLMPGMDGYELTRRLKLEPATAGMSVMFYTAYFGGQDAKQLASALGVARVLVKPSDNDIILRAVDEVLSSRPGEPPVAPPDLDRDHLRLMVDQLLEKTTALEAQQQRVERMNRTLALLSAINALIVRADDRHALLEEACRIAVEKGGFRLAAVGLADPNRRLALAARAGEGSPERELERLRLGTQPMIWNDVQAGSYVALPLIANDEPAGVVLL